MTPANKINGNQTGEPFFIPITIPFTSTANESKTAYSNAVQSVADLDIISAITDLERAQATFTIDRKPIWSGENIPFAMIAGRPDGPKPIVYHQPPTPLGKRQRVRVDALNVGGEPQGTLVLNCRQVGVEAPMAQALSDFQGQGEPDVVVLDSQFTATSALTDAPKNTPSAIIDDHFIWRTLHTTLGGASVRIFGINNRAWMDDFTPLWALAGRFGSQIPNQSMQPAIFIPAGYAIHFEFKNDGVGGVAETSGKVFLGGQRVAAR